MAIKSTETDLTNTSLKSAALFFWHFHRKLIISLIVLLAIILIILRSLALYLETNPQVIEKFIESYLNSPVSFKEIKVTVNPFFPTVSMTDFVINNETGDKQSLKFASAGIKLNVARSIFHGQTIVDTLALEGVSVFIRRKANGEIVLAGLKLTNGQQNVDYSEAMSQSYLQLLNQSNLIINQGEILFIDERHEYPTVFYTDIKLKMKNQDDRHQVLLQASLNDSDTRLDFRLDFTGKIDDLKNWDGKVYGAIDKLNHQSILQFLGENVLQIENFKINDIETSAKVWTAIEAGNLQSIHGELSVKNARLVRIDRDQAIRFDHLSTNFKLERLPSHEPDNSHELGNSDEPVNSLDSVNTHEPASRHEHINSAISDVVQQETSWSIDLYDLNLNINSKAMTKKHLKLKYHKDKNDQFPQLNVFLNSLDLGDFSHVISFFSPKKINSQMFQILKPKGRLNNILSTLKLKSLEMPIDIISYQVQADIEGFSINSFQSIPKIRNFSAHVLFNEALGRATINSHDMKLHVKSLFRDSWPVTQLEGEIYWQKEESGWLIGGENLQVYNPHLKASANLKLWFAKNGQTFMDLTGFYHDANVKYVPYYLPASIMSDDLVKWLDESIISGWGTDGGVVYRGNLSQFPYGDHSGAMDIVFNTSDVVLEFQKDWPKLTDIKAQVQFTEEGMGVEAQQSNIYSAVSNNIQVDIERYLQPVLQIKGNIKSSVDDAVLFLKQSKLVTNDVLAILDAKGNVGIELDLSIPMEKGKPDSKVNISLNNINYYPPGFVRRNGFINKLKGDVTVHNQSINAKKLTAKIMGHPANISIKTAKPLPAENKDPLVSVFIDTQVSIKKLAAYKLFPSWSDALKDQLSGSSRIKLAINLPNNQQLLNFSLNSDLVGVSSRLPSPFAKQTKNSSPVKINFKESVQSRTSKKTVSTARLNIDYTDSLSLALLFDTSRKEFELLKGNVVLQGGQAKLPKNKALKLSGSLTDLHLEQWRAILASQSPASNKKKIRKKSATRKAIIPIELAMKEVVLPELNRTSEAEEKANSSTNFSLEPGYFPIVNGTIETLKLGKVDLGKLSIQSHRIKEGIVFDLLALRGKLLSLEGNGKWHPNIKPKVNLKAEIKIPSMENFFKNFGFDQLIRKGKGKARVNFSWPGSLTDISMQTIVGDIYVNIQKGAYLEGKPGAAGRLLGLLNMNALARRISLDFSDVSEKGFEFDRIKGDFQLAHGNAKTENLLMIAPSTKILVIGRTGMVAEDFDQRVTVIPEVSATLPIAGAAVAGPAGAAVVWVGQKLLGKQLNQITAYDYTVKGSWKDPVIKRDKTSKNTLKNVKKLLGFDKKTATDSGDSVIIVEESNLP